LYTQTLGYEIHDEEKGYYADGEDAYDMRLYFKKGGQVNGRVGGGRGGEGDVVEGIKELSLEERDAKKVGEEAEA